MNTHNETIKILKKQGALTIDMQEAFVRGTPEVYYSDEHSVYLKHGCGVMMLWADSVDGAMNAVERFEQPRSCVLHGEAAQKAFHTWYKGEIGTPCMQYCRMSREKFEVPPICTIRPLTEDDIAFVAEHYQLSNSPDYLRWRISEGELHGAEVNGKLVGFIGSHGDGSIGMLEVIPEFRRRRIGTALEFYQMNRHIDKGWTPYGQVYIDNPESKLLQKKVGLDVARETICWTHNK